MAPTPDDKKNRLSGLSQDVIAVGSRTSKAPAVAPSPTAARQTEAPADTRPTPPQRAAGVPPAAAPGQAGAPAGKGLAVAVGVLGVLVVGLVIAGMQLFSSSGSLREAVEAGRVSDQQLQDKLVAAQERIAKLEAQLGAADEDARSMGSASQASLLQVSAMSREMRKEIERLSAAINELDQEVGDLRRLAEGNRKDAQNALVLAEKVNARIGAVNDQILAAGRKPAAASVPPEVQEQLKVLGDRTEKLTGDVRQLYRLVERR
jgi:hypothetical protein